MSKRILFFAPSHMFACHAALLTSVFASSSHAEIIPDDPPFRNCAAEFVVMPQLPWNPEENTTPNITHVESDEARVEGDTDKVYTFNGAVTVQRGDQWIQGERVIYRNTGANAEASGGVNLWQNDLLISGDSARFSFSEQRGVIDRSIFFLKERHARGSAERIELESKTETVLQKTTYTTCETYDESWHLNARTLTLDTANDVGTATHVWIDFKNVPIFYFPYLNFPLSGRKSGFLFPTIGRSTRLGTRLAVPFYWNIAPDRDATLTLQNFTARGQQVLGEFRYLNPHSNGQLDVEYLSTDKVTDTERTYLAYKHNWNPAPRWLADANYRYASDKDYFRDFGDRLSTTEIVHLERNAHINFRGDVVTAQVSAVEYQTLDSSIAATDRPYKTLPNVSVRAVAPGDYYGFRGQFDAGAVRFVSNSDARVSAVRMYTQPSISYPLENIAGYFRPKVSLHQTWYALSNQAADIDDHSARSVPILSADSGLFFERDFTIGQANFLHTLEPRVFYLYAPYREQNRLIADADGTERVFDSSLNALSYSQLFAENRFAGGDRVGDADQYTLALTSRLIDNNGAERVSASLGRIYYRQDREVSLPGGIAETAPRSNIIAELRARPVPFLDVTSNAQWDSNLDTFTQATAQIRYQPHKRRILNVGLRINRDNNGDFTQQETDVSAVWPVNNYWSVIARRNYSLLAHRDKEWLAGVEYDSCCWALRFVSRGYVTNTNDPDWAQHPDIQRTLMLQLELKGLSSVGQNIQSLLGHAEHGIAGY